MTVYIQFQSTGDFRCYALTEEIKNIVSIPTGIWKELDDETFNSKYTIKGLLPKLILETDVIEWYKPTMPIL